MPSRPVRSAQVNSSRDQSRSVYQSMKHLAVKPRNRTCGKKHQPSNPLVGDTDFTSTEDPANFPEADL